MWDVGACLSDVLTFIVKVTMPILAPFQQISDDSFASNDLVLSFSVTAFKLHG
jgi:hypothetical protein